MSTLLLAQDIGHSFDYELFSNINFELQSGESVAILGRSGSGKSTLLHIFSSFTKPNFGNVELLSNTLYSLSTQEMEMIRRHDIGIVFQSHYLFKGMKAFDNIEIASLLSNQNIDKSLLEALQIEETMEQRIGELSGGQQQRVSIARVLSKKPKIIFADEPTGNLDKETARLVMNVLLKYTKEHNSALLLVTHDEEMAKMCEKKYLLEDKKLTQF